MSACMSDTQLTNATSIQRLLPNQLYSSTKIDKTKNKIKRGAQYKQHMQILNFIAQEDFASVIPIQGLGFSPRVAKFTLERITRE